MEGTYPLPEAQLDRFFCKLLVKYPHPRDLETILDRTTESIDPKASPVVSGERILQMSHIERQIPIAPEVRRYGIAIVLATHSDQALAPSLTRRYVRYGASPRGLQAIILGAKIKAILDDRYNVARDDIRAMTLPVLRHRIILNFEGQAEGVSTDAVIENIVNELPEDTLAAA
jgi:MoxR-like ATPase